MSNINKCLLGTRLGYERCKTSQAVHSVVLMLITRSVFHSRTLCPTTTPPLKTPTPRSVPWMERRPGLTVRHYTGDIHVLIHSVRVIAGFGKSFVWKQRVCYIVMWYRQCVCSLDVSFPLLGLVSGLVLSGWCAGPRCSFTTYLWIIRRSRGAVCKTLPHPSLHKHHTYPNWYSLVIFFWWMQQ